MSKVVGVYSVAYMTTIKNHLSVYYKWKQHQQLGGLNLLLIMPGPMNHGRQLQGYDDKADASPTSEDVCTLGERMYRNYLHSLLNIGDYSVQTWVSKIGCVYCCL